MIKLNWSVNPYGLLFKNYIDSDAVNEKGNNSPVSEYCYKITDDIIELQKFENYLNSANSEIETEKILKIKEEAIRRVRAIEDGEKAREEIRLKERESIKQKIYKIENSDNFKRIW